MKRSEPTSPEATTSKRRARRGKNKAPKKSNENNESPAISPAVTTPEATTPKRIDGCGKTKAPKKGNDNNGSPVISPVVTIPEVTISKRTARRGKTKAKKGNDANQLAFEALRQFALATVQKGVQGLLSEFKKVNQETLARPVKTAFDMHPDKNRYTDVYCMDQQRVILTWPQGSINDYIHANYVSVQGQRKFICTQGPTEKTVDDFWRMVWQEKVQGIVMLCRLFEEGKKKCEAYYPEARDGIMTTTSNIRIKNIGVVDSEKVLTINALEVTAEDKTVVINHFLWKAWPDRGVPKNMMAALRLLARLKDISPVVVHCSAGIGRTGTIVGLQIAQDTILHGENLQMANVVKELRSQRFGAVQSDNQYLYMHRVMLGLAENKKAMKSDELEPFFNEYESFLKSQGF